MRKEVGRLKAVDAKQKRLRGGAALLRGMVLLTWGNVQLELAQCHHTDVVGTQIGRVVDPAGTAASTAAASRQAATATVGAAWPIGKLLPDPSQSMLSTAQAPHELAGE